MLFKNETFEEVFKNIYADFAKKYHLEIEESNEHCVLLVSDNFILQFNILSKGLYLTYFRLADRKSFDITNYVFHLADEQERIKIHNPEDGLINAAEVEAELPIMRDVLDAHLVDLIEGNSSWFDIYKKSKWYRPAMFISFN